MTEFSHKINRLCQVVVRHPDFLFRLKSSYNLIIEPKQITMRNRENIIEKFKLQVVGIVALVILGIRTLYQLEEAEEDEKAGRQLTESGEEGK